MTIKNVGNEFNHHKYLKTILSMYNFWKAKGLETYVKCFSTSLSNEYKLQVFFMREFAIWESDTGMKNNIFLCYRLLYGSFYSLKIPD